MSKSDRLLTSLAMGRYAGHAVQIFPTSWAGSAPESGSHGSPGSLAADDHTGTGQDHSGSNSSARTGMPALLPGAGKLRQEYLYASGSSAECRSSQFRDTFLLVSTAVPMSPQESVLRPNAIPGSRSCIADKTPCLRYWAPMCSLVVVSLATPRNSTDTWSNSR